MERDLFWTNLLRRIAKQGSESYNDLKYMDIEEFFLIVIDYERTITQQ